MTLMWLPNWCSAFDPLAVAGVCVVLALGLAGWYALRPHPINRANFERIQEGMTCADVEAILGGPPGDYTTPFDLPLARSFGMQRVTAWFGDEGCVGIKFDDEGRVRMAWFAPSRRSQMSLLQRLRAWLGW